LCLISGNFDLSIDRIAGISVLMGGLILTRWLPDTPGILAVIFVIIFGALLGAVNGFIVGKVRVNSFLVTLSTYLIYLYLAYYLLAAPIGSNQLPSSFFWLGKAKMFGINVSFILFVILGLILNFILRRTSFGVSVYATGVDNSISNALGINTGNVIFYIYTIAGAIAGIAGLAYVGFVGSVTNSIATGEVFWTFAGAILGGVSLSGGRGSIINVIGGSLFIGLVTTGVLVFNIVATLRMVVAGVIILISILLSKAIENWEQKIILSNND
jgi:ribose/xylose/arabinose/galactoside ABC-type transport system permease subunit